MERVAPTPIPPPPRTLGDAVRYFAAPGRAFAYAVRLRWPDGVVCPACGSRDVAYLARRRLWKCRHTHPRGQFSVRAGTIFEDSPIPLGKWFVAIWIAANRAGGVTTYELARTLGVTQKTAWLILQRIRTALTAGSLMRPASEAPASSAADAGAGDCTIVLAPPARRRDAEAHR
jgi:Transposase zinc-ribbon domain